MFILIIYLIGGLIQKDIMKKIKKRALRKNKILILLIIVIFLLILVVLIAFKTKIVDYLPFVGKTILKTEDCDEWSKCYFTYDLDDSDNIILDGEQKRTCRINSVEKVETKTCFPRESITAKKAGNYIEVYDSNRKLISKLEIVKEPDSDYNKLNIDIFEW